MKQDRFLMVILGVIGALVVIALVLFFVRQGSQNYGAEDAPEGIIRNYVIALQKGDLQRAYGYLGEGQNKPTYLAFQQSITNRQVDPASASMSIGKTNILADGSASVTLTLLHSNNDPFGSTYTDQQMATVVKQNGIWKLSSMPYPFWSYDWYLGQVPDGKTIPALPAPVGPVSTATP
jgi:hypothetical protein